MHFHPNLWPERPSDLRSACAAYFRAMCNLAATVMRIFATALDLRADFFDDKIDRHISRLRARNDPERTDGAVDQRPLTGHEHLRRQFLRTQAAAY